MAIATLTNTILFILLFAAFFLGELGRFEIYPHVTVIALDIAVFFVILNHFGFPSAIKKSFKPILIKPIALFVFICLLSLFFNSDRYALSEIGVAFLYLLRWIAYASLFYIVKTQETNIKKIIEKCMVVVGFAIVIAGYVQYFYYPFLRNLYYLGWDEHLYRMFSVFLDPNFAGIFFVLYLLFLFPNIMKQKQPSVSYYLTVCIAVVTFIAIFLTYSRTTIIMLIISGIVFAYLQKKIKMLLIGLLCVLVSVLITPFILQSEGTNLLRTSSTFARFESAKNAWSLFLEDPVFGVGFNAYRYAQIEKGFIEEKPQYPNLAGAGTDNSYLFVLTTTGVVGFTAYMYFLFSLGKRLLRKVHMVHKQERTWHTVVFCSFIGICVSALFINSLFYPFVLVWLWIWVGLRD